MASKKLTSRQNGLLGGRPSHLHGNRSSLARELFFAGHSLKEISKLSALPISTLYRYARSWAGADVRVGVSWSSQPTFSILNERRIIHSLCRMLKVRPIFVNQSFPDLLASLEESKVDFGLSLMEASEERKLKMHFTSGYSRQPDKIGFYSLTKARVFSLDQVYKGSFGAVRGTLHEKFLRNLGVSTRLAADDAQLESLFLNGKVDVVLSNRTVLSENFLENATQVPTNLSLDYGNSPAIALAKKFAGGENITRLVERMLSLGMIDCLDQVITADAHRAKDFLSAYENLQSGLSL